MPTWKQISSWYAKDTSKELKIACIVYSPNKALDCATAMRL